MARPAHMALLLAVPILAIAGCGGGNDDSASKTSAAGGASGQQGTTGPQTGATGATTKRGTRPQRTGKRRQGSSRNGGAGLGNTAPPAAAAPTAPKKPADTVQLTPKQLRQAGRALYKQARIVCKAYTLEGLAEQYHVKGRDPDDVAKAYAAGYAVGLRQQVAAGCKKGLLEAQ
jgi:hypothetical protein